MHTHFPAATDLHEEEEQQDDKDADVRVQPGGGAAQAGRGRRSRNLCPGEVIEQGVDALSGHQLERETQGRGGEERGRKEEAEVRVKKVTWRVQKK